uniref:TPR_REGION domain-containing protein n=1 Tax=Rhabditophanes sp. KR3021 TaxID=114890 RepID=A0AC35TMC1_9BILA
MTTTSSTHSLRVDKAISEEENEKKIEKSPGEEEIEDEADDKSQRSHIGSESQSEDENPNKSSMKKQYKNLTEFPLYLKGLLHLEEQDFREALKCFEEAFLMNTQNQKYLLEIGRLKLFLGEQHKAILCFTKVLQMSERNWKAHYWKALAIYLENRNSADSCTLAIDSLVQCPSNFKIPQVLLLASKFCFEKGDIPGAIEALKRVIEMDRNNLDAMHRLGLIYSKTGNDSLAFAIYGQALSTDSSHVPSIIGAGAIIQKNGDLDVALNKYRIAAFKSNHIAVLWSNIGMCYYGKGKYVAAISCLKRANYLSPSDWQIFYNMALIYESMQQYASAYQYCTAALSMEPANSSVVATLASILEKLTDDENACKAHLKILEVQDEATPLRYLNYAIFEYKRYNASLSRELLRKFYQLWDGGSYEDPFGEVDEMARRLRFAVVEITGEELPERPNEFKTEEGHEGKRNENLILEA